MNLSSPTNDQPTESGKIQDSGTLTIKVVRAEFIRNTEQLSEMDPYVVILYKDKKYKTKVIQEGGKKPVWNEQFEIPIVSLQD